VNKLRSFAFALSLVLASTAAVAAGLPLKPAATESSDFPLVLKGRSATIVADKADAEVVRIAADMLAGDVERVTGVKPAVTDAVPNGGAPVIVIGTVGRSALIDDLVNRGKLDVKAITGQWESYVVATVPNAFPGVAQALVIAGSDRRGTAYGAMEISDTIGVSPWIWWADVAPVKRESLVLGAGTHVQGPPSVKYRGLFINDEDWGLQPWAAKTVEPKSAGGVGDVGPKTYARVFELLLRLRANLCWPAMHDCTKAFNIYPENKVVADRYAIVMGSSHCEPMLRNNVTEWPHDRAADYNYVTNRQGVLDYWKQRVVENGKYENVYTLGMRGIHDSDMLGGGTPPERAARLNSIMADERAMIRDLVNPNVSAIPQIFCPYKEVLTLYQLGAVPPDDVTMVWADDNHGYIRQLSTPEEQKRQGGAGVYYHISYWGRPHDYLWLCTTPPSLVWEELSKAYDYGARNLWVINVGDIKPGEIDLTLAMRMAYDIGSYSVETIGRYPEDFAKTTFGPECAAEIGALLRAYYQLNYQRKPEHMGFNTSQNPGGPIQPTEFSDEEIQVRLAAFGALRAEADRLYAAMPADQRDAFYELIVYPVRGATLQNQKLLWADINRRAAAVGNAALASEAAGKSKAAYDAIQTETAYYNNDLAGGKWRHMMSSTPHNTDVHKLPKFAQGAAGAGATAVAPATAKFTPATPSPLGAKSDTARAFVENDGYLSIPAENFTRKQDRNGAAWRVIPGLGRFGDSMAVFPTTAPSLDPSEIAAKAPVLEFDITTKTPATRAVVTVQAIPTHRIHPGRGLRYAVAIDSEAPQVVDLETPENSAIWSKNVLRGSAYGTTEHPLQPGRHTVRVYMVDPGVVIDHLTIDLGGLPKSYLPPAATVAR
jgi:hypothetical protein